MITANVREARLNLSKLLKMVEWGENIIIRNRFTPIARIIPYRQETGKTFPDLTAFRHKVAKSRGFKTGKTELLIRADREERP